MMCSGILNTDNTRIHQYDTYTYLLMDFPYELIITHLLICVLICVSAEFHLMEGVGCITCDNCESTVHGNQPDDVYSARP